MFCESPGAVRISERFVISPQSFPNRACALLTALKVFQHHDGCWFLFKSVAGFTFFLSDTEGAWGMNEDRRRVELPFFCWPQLPRSGEGFKPAEHVIFKHRNRYVQHLCRRPACNPECPRSGLNPSSDHPYVRNRKAYEGQTLETHGPDVRFLFLFYGPVFPPTCLMINQIFFRMYVLHEYLCANLSITLKQAPVNSHDD